MRLLRITGGDPLSRGEACDLWKDQRAPISKRLCGSTLPRVRSTLFAIGSMVETAWQVRKKLAEKGITTTVVNARFAMPLDEKAILSAAESHPLIVTMEENVASGDLKSIWLHFWRKKHCIQKVLPVAIAIPDCFVNMEVLDA